MTPRIPPPLTSEVDTLWSYLAVSARPGPADAIFVFGSADFRVPARAAELYHEGYAPHVLISGSFGLRTRDVFPKPEADVFADQLVADGVPRAFIVTEPRATNTLENVRLGMEALHRHGVACQRVLLVAKEFVMRRCVATFARHYSRTDVTPCPPLGGPETARDRSATALALRLAAEVDRLETYGDRGDIQRQTIPLAVRAAADAITRSVHGSGSGYG